MLKTALVTDSNCSLPMALTDARAILQVPIAVLFGSESFRAVTELDDVNLFNRIDREGKFPTTSAPSPGDFAEKFKQAFDKGYEDIICFTTSSEVSATYNAAVNAAGMWPDRSIKVIDSRTLTAGLGVMVMAASDALMAGAPPDEAIAQALAVRERSYLFGALATLKYLAMSGRVGHLAAGLANLLEVKPIVTIRNGKLDMLERVRTQHKAWARVIELCAEKAEGHAIERMHIVHVNALDSARFLEEKLRATLPCPQDILISPLTPGMSPHSGAGMVGVAFVLSR